MDGLRSRSASPPPPAAYLKKRDYIIGILLLLVVVFLWTSSNFVTQVLDRVLPRCGAVRLNDWCIGPV